MPRFKDFLELHFVIFLWGFTAILGKLITIPAVELVLSYAHYSACTGCHHLQAGHPFLAGPQKRA